MAASVGCSSRDHSEWRNRIPTTKTSGSRPSGLFRRASRWLRSMDIASLALRAPIRSSRPKVWAHCVKCVWQSHNPGIAQRPSASMMGAGPPVAVAEIREPAGVIAAIAPALDRDVYAAGAAREPRVGDYRHNCLYLPSCIRSEGHGRMWQKHRTYPFAPRLLGQLHQSPSPYPPPNCVASPSTSRLNRLSSVHASLL